MSSPSKCLPLVVASVSGALAATAICRWRLQDRKTPSTTSENGSPNPVVRRCDLKLPRTLAEWRCPGTTLEAEEAVWRDLPPVFAARGYTLWPHYDCSYLVAPHLETVARGFAYVTPSRGLGWEVGGAMRMTNFQYINTLTRVAFSGNGQAVVIRVLTLNGEGAEHLRILRKIATGPYTFLSTNHSLPMLDEVHLEDVVFGVFPFVGGLVRHAYDSWASNSVGDILNILMQALEALAFIHGMGIAHRDAFKDNFLIQWQPDSLSSGHVSVSQPRVYLIDFEVAVDFGPDCPPEDRLCRGRPTGGSMSEVERYIRPLPFGFDDENPYDPFKLDVWQLGYSFASEFKTDNDLIDDLVMSMADVDPVLRPTASEALDKLLKIVAAIPPAELHIPPIVLEDDGAGHMVAKGRGELTQEDSTGSEPRPCSVTV